MGAGIAGIGSEIVHWPVNDGQPRRGCDRDWIVHGEEDPALDVTNGSMLGFPRFDRNRRVAAQAMRDSAPDRCLFGAFKCLMLLSNCLFARN
ncbi:hypothetical protein, partial [Nitrobacter sp.]|uniref:hypothetical protein n=1 Tax=Nitrobacter sp. TaxID=29420 RepID=UPI002628A062